MEMLIQSKILKGILTNFLKKTSKKKLGEDFDLDIQNLKVNCKDDRTDVVLTISANISTNKIPVLLKNFDII